MKASESVGKYDSEVRLYTNYAIKNIKKVCKDYEAHLLAAGQDCRAGQPTPGNKAGGLSTLDEKSLLYTGFSQAARVVVVHSDNGRG